MSGTLTTPLVTFPPLTSCVKNIFSHMKMDGDTGPKATFSSDTGCPTNLAPTTVTITFPEDMTGFVEGDLVLVGCTSGNFVNTVPTSVWTVELTPTGDGPFSMEIPAGVCTSTADGTENARAIFRCTYDTTDPTPTVSGPTTVEQGASTDFTITFDESVTGLVLGDITVTGASADALTGSGASYTLTVTPTLAGTDVTIQVPATVCQDAAGNDNVASNLLTATTIVVSQPVPTISGTAQSADQTWTLTVTFDQPVSGLTAGDFTLTGGYTASNLTGSGASYTIDVTGAVIDVAGTIQLPASTVTGDVGGLNNVASNTYAIEWISFSPETLSQDLLQWN